MKTITAHIVRVTLLLTLYVCCSSVVCCEASKISVLESPSGKRFEKINFSNESIDEDITPLQILLVRIAELL